jgi:hypothetical protein
MGYVVLVLALRSFLILSLIRRRFRCWHAVICRRKERDLLVQQTEQHSAGGGVRDFYARSFRSGSAGNRTPVIRLAQSARV